jgi:MoaA/NifB/PqqE/SkfB family radical SAM enzyme
MMPSSMRANKYDTLCVELTTRCALRCVHCSTSAGSGRRDFLELDVFRATLDALGGTRELYLSGGEPFEHPQIGAFVEAASSRTDRVVAYTSGAVIQGDAIASVPRALLKDVAARGLDRVDVSLYSASDTEHDAVTDSMGSFAITLAFLERAREAGIPFGVHFVPLVSGGERVADVARFARGLGASRFHVLALVRQGRATAMDDQVSPSFLGSLRGLEDEPGFEIVFSSLIRRALGEGPTERDTWRAGFVDVHGTPHPCEGRRLSGKRLLTARAESSLRLLGV